MRIRLVLALLVGLAATPAVAVPVTYGFESGSLSLTAVREDNGNTVISQSFDLDGSFITWDPDGSANLGSGSLDDLLITAGAQTAFNLLEPYGPHDVFTVESIAFAPGVGMSTLIGLSTGVNEWSFLVNPIDNTLIYTGEDSNLVNPTVNSTALPVVFGQIRGNLFADGVDLVLTTTLASGVVAGADFGESSDLVVSYEITWNGSTAALVPEPTTGATLALGLLALARMRRR